MWTKISRRGGEEEKTPYFHLVVDSLAIFLTPADGSEGCIETRPTVNIDSEI